MSAPLTILHLTHDGRGAGASISIALLARAQQRAGHRVLVGCPAGSWLAGLLERSGVASVAIEFDSLRQASGEIARLVRSEPVQVVNAHSSRDRAATRRLRLRGRLPSALVMTRRAMPMSSPVSAIASGFAADRTIAVSRPVARALARRGTPPWRIRVVHNAVDLERLDRVVTDAERGEAWARVAERLESNGWWLMAGSWWTGNGPVVGVVSRPKDHDVLLRALEHVRTPVTLVSVGFERDASSYQQPATSLHRVAFLPFTDDPRPFYDLFDLVVLPSRHEGFSQSLLEAMALGRPVAATGGGGNRELIEDGVHGLLVPPGDAPSLGAAIQRLLDDPALRARLGAAARERVRTCFTIERTAAATEAVYREALARR